MPEAEKAGKGVSALTLRPNGRSLVFLGYQLCEETERRFNRSC